MKIPATGLVLVLLLCIITTFTFAQPRIGITGGMNLSVLTGTVNMETNLKPGIMLGGVVDILVFHHPLTTWRWSFPLLPPGVGQVKEGEDCRRQSGGGKSSRNAYL